jgi:hypothetical protein
MHALSALHGLAGPIVGLTLLAFGITVFGTKVLWQLRRDRLALQAAERFEAVNMTAVVQRHVPGYLQSNKADEEFAIVRQGIAKKFPRWIKLVALSGVVTLSAGLISWILIDRNWQLIAAAQLAEQTPKPVDALNAIAGVWGWKHEFLQSCSQNAHTIALTDGNKGLSVRFAKPLWDGSKEVSGLEYTIVGIEPNKLVLESAQYPKQSDSLHRPPVRWYYKFSDADTYQIGRSDELWTTGDIVRCH